MLPVVFLSSVELELCAFTIIGAKILVIMVEIEPKYPPPPRSSSKSRKPSASGNGTGCSFTGTSSTRRRSRHNTISTRGVRQHTNRHHRMLEPSSLPPRWGEGVAPPPTPQYNNTPHVSPESSEMTGAGASIRYHHRRRIERENPASSSSSTLAFRSSQQSMSCRTVAILVT